MYTLEEREEKDIKESLKIANKQQTCKEALPLERDRKCRYDGNFKPH